MKGLLLNNSCADDTCIFTERSSVASGESLGVVAGGVASHRHPHKRKCASPSRRPLGVPATLIEPLNGVTTH